MHSMNIKLNQNSNNNIDKTLSHFQKKQQQKQLLGTTTPTLINSILINDNNHNQNMYRLSSFNESSTTTTTSSPTPLSSKNNNNVGISNHNNNNEFSALMTPTYESIDVNNLIDTHQHHQQQQQHHHHHHTHNINNHRHHSTYNDNDPTTSVMSTAVTSTNLTAAAAVYADSSQGTSENGHEESTGCMSDNPTVTIPDNHHLYPAANTNNNSHYYNRTLNSIMPISGLMTPLQSLANNQQNYRYFYHNNNYNNNHNYNPYYHHYPFTMNGGYLTRSSNYYYHYPEYHELNNHQQQQQIDISSSSTSSQNHQTSSSILYGQNMIDDTCLSPSSTTANRPPFLLSSPLITKEEDYDIFNAIFALISLMLYVCCIGSTLILSYFLWNHEQDLILFWLTILASIVPSIIVNIISLKWLLNDNQRQQQFEKYYHQQQQKQQQQQQNLNFKTTIEPYFLRRPTIGPCGWMLRLLLHLILLGPVLRYVELLRYGVKSWSDKRRRIDFHKKDGINSWSTIASTTLPSLSTTLPRTRFNQSTINGPGGLPDFEPAIKSNKDNEKIPSSTSSSVLLNRIDYYLLTIAEDRDTSLLSLFHCLMQSTIQIILHLYSIITHRYFEHHHHINNYNHNYTEYLQITVIALALFEISWSISSYHRALRRASFDKRNLSAFGTIAQSFWHTFTIASRLLAIALFLHQFTYWLLPIGIGHWGIMTIWIMHQGTHFFDTELGQPNPCQEYLFNMLIGLIYLFVFINLKDEPTRYKYTSFYTIIMIEDLTFATSWYLRVETDYFWSLKSLLFISVPMLFIFGIIFMLFYYWFLHPNGRPLIINKSARCC